MSLYVDKSIDVVKTVLMRSSGPLTAKELERLCGGIQINTINKDIYFLIKMGFKIPKRYVKTATGGYWVRWIENKKEMAHAGEVAAYAQACCPSGA